LVKVGREKEARFILGRLRGTEGADVAAADAEFKDIQNVAEMEKSTSHSNTYFSMLFGIGSGDLHIGRRVQLVIWLQILQEWVGIAGVTICMCSKLSAINVLTGYRCPNYLPNCWFHGREESMD
jgi:hypothetical protein